MKTITEKLANQLNSKEKAIAVVDTSQEKTVTIPYDLYISISDALLRLGNFAFHASVIADNLKTCEQNGGKGTWSNIAMLGCLAEDADSICGQQLADEICNIAAEQTS